MTERPSLLPATPKPSPFATSAAARSTAEDAACAFGVAATRRDPLSSVLRSVRLTGAQFFIIDASSPWCVDVPAANRFADIILPGAQHIISYHVVLEGDGWASVAGLEPIPFGSGDIIVFPHGDGYLMESAPGTPPELDTDQTLAFFEALAAGQLPFVVTEGGGQPPPAKFICGFLGCDVRPFNPILSSLPRLLRLQRPQESRGDLLDRLIELTLEEAKAPRAGSESIRLGLSELMFIELLRRYAHAPGPKARGWIAGLQDAAVGRALELMHERPADPWTVSSLAGKVGASRSALAQRFAALVGHPPVRYLTLWRMQLAAGHLAESTLSIAEIGHRVGYRSEAAFSRTFKKTAGVSPDTWRRAAWQSA